MLRAMKRFRLLQSLLGIAITCLSLNTLRTTSEESKRENDILPLSTSRQQRRSREKHDDRSNTTLVIIIGNLRGGEKAWRTLYENVLDSNSADLALMIGETVPKHANATLFGRAKYHWNFPEYDDWADALDLINGTAWRDSLIPLMHKWSTILGGVKKHKFAGSGAVIFMIRWFLSNKLTELGLVHKYERFVITRSDHYYLCTHDLSKMSKRYLHVPKGEDCGGVTDRHLIVSADHVLAALDILPPLLQNPEAYSKLIVRRSGNPEKVLQRRWREAGLKVRRFDRMMFTCGEPGDMTRWRSLSGSTVPEGVQLKYPHEYNSSHVTCGL